MKNAIQWATIIADSFEPPQQAVPGYVTITTLPDGTNVVVLLQPSRAGAQSGRFGRGVDKNLSAAYAQAVAALSRRE
jgi:hypothetical protein